MPPNRQQVVLQYIIQAQNQAQQAFAAQNQMLANMQKQLAAVSTTAANSTNAITQLANAIGKMGRSVGAGAAGGVVAGEALVGAFSGVQNQLADTVRMASRFENAFIAISSVAGALGQDVDKAKEAAASLASDGLMRVDEAIQSLQNLLLAGFGLDEAIELMRGFKDIAAFNRQASLDFGYSIVSATEGIKNQNSILVDNMGLTKNLGIILREQGKSVQDLARVSTDASVREALRVGLLKETALFTGNARRATETYSGELSRMKTQFQLLQAEIGEKFLPGMKEVNSVLGFTLETMRSSPQIVEGLAGTLASLAITAGSLLVFSKVGGWITVARGALAGILSGAISLTSAFGLLSTGIVAFGGAIAGFSFGKFLTGLSETWQEGNNLFTAMTKWADPVKLLQNLFDWFGATGFVLWVGRLTGVIESTSQAEQITARLAQATKIAGREIEDAAEAERIINEELQKNNAELERRFGIIEKHRGLGFSNLPQIPGLPKPPEFNFQLQQPTIPAIPNLAFEPRALEGLTKQTNETIRRLAEERADISQKMVDQIIRSLTKGQQSAKDISAEFEKLGFKISPETITKIKEDWDEQQKLIEQSRKRLEDFNKTLQEFQRDFAAANRAGFSTEELREMFADRAKDLIKEQRILREIYGPAVREVTEDIKRLVAAEQEIEYGNRLKEIEESFSTLPNITKEFGENLEFLHAAIANGLQITDAWIESNFDVIKVLAAQDPQFQGLITRYHELEAAQRRVAAMTEALSKQESLHQELFNTFKNTDFDVDMTDEFIKLTNASIEQQIRSATAGVNRRIKEERRAKKEIETIWKGMNVYYQALNKDRFELLQAHHDSIIDLNEVAADIEIAQAVNVSEAIVEQWAEQARQIQEVWRQVMADGFVTPEELAMVQAMTQAFAAMRKPIIEAATEFAKLKKHIQEIIKVGDAFADMFSAFGMESIADAIGNVTDSIEKASAGAESFTKGLDALSQGKTAAGIMGLAQGVANMAAGIGQATSQGSRLQRILGGITTGAVTGFQVAGVWGAVGGAIVGGFVGAFRDDDEWKKTQDYVAKRFGTKISQELSSVIQTTMERLDIGRDLASRIHLGDIIDQAGGFIADMPQFAQQMNDLVDDIDLLFEMRNFGAASEAVEGLGNAFTEMVETMETQMNGVVNPEMVEFIRNARDAGFEIQELNQFLEAMADEAIEGVVAVTSGVFGQINRNFTTVEDAIERIYELAADRSRVLTELTRTSAGTAEYARLQRELETIQREFDRLNASARGAAEGLLGLELEGMSERADRVGRLLNVTFEAALTSGKGFVETLIGLSPALDQITDAQERFGFEVNATTQRLIDLNQWAVDNSDLATSIDGLNQLMRGLANQGALTQEIFADLGAEARAQFDDLTRSGLAQNDVLTLMQPTLQRIWELQKRFGYEVDATTQALLDEAEASGRIGTAHQSVYDRIIDGLDRIASGIEKMTGVLTGGLLDKILAFSDDIGDIEERAGDATAKFGDLGRETTNALALADSSIQTVSTSMRQMEEITARTRTTMVAAFESVKQSVDKVTFGSSPGGITDLIAHLDLAVDAFNNAGAAGSEAFDRIAQELQRLNDEVTELQLGGIQLRQFQLDRQHREDIQRWLEATRGESQAIIDQGLDLIDQAFNLRMQKLQEEESKKLQRIMFDIDNELLSLTLNSAEAALHELQVEQFDMIERFLEETEGASQEFIDSGIDKIHQIFQLRAQQLRDEARGTQEIARQMTPVVTALGNGLLRIQGADVVFGDMMNMFDGAATTAQRWASNTVASAGVVLDAINAVSFGHSPGGLKEIPTQLDYAISGVHQFARIYQNEMHRVESMVTQVGDTIDDRLAGERHLDVTVNKDAALSRSIQTATTQAGMNAQGAARGDLTVVFSPTISVSGVLAGDGVDQQLIKRLMNELAEVLKLDGHDQARFRQVVVRGGRIR